MNLTDQLAIERTKLANERTFLSYFRTFIVLLSSGFAVIKLSLLEDIKVMGYVLMALSLVMVIIGLFRFRHIRKSLEKYSSQ